MADILAPNVPMDLAKKIPEISAIRDAVAEMVSDQIGDHILFSICIVDPVDMVDGKNAAIAATNCTDDLGKLQHIAVAMSEAALGMAHMIGSNQTPAGVTPS